MKILNGALHVVEDTWELGTCLSATLLVLAVFSVEYCSRRKRVCVPWLFDFACLTICRHFPLKFKQNKIYVIKI